MSVNFGDVLGVLAVGLGAVAVGAAVAHDPEGFISTMEKIEKERQDRATALKSEELVKIVRRVSVLDRVAVLEKYRSVTTKGEFQKAVSFCLSQGILSVLDTKKALDLI